MQIAALLFALPLAAAALSPSARLTRREAGLALAAAGGASSLSFAPPAQALSYVGQPGVKLNTGVSFPTCSVCHARARARVLSRVANAASRAGAARSSACRCTTTRRRGG